MRREPFPLRNMNRLFDQPEETGIPGGKTGETGVFPR